LSNRLKPGDVAAAQADQPCYFSPERDALAVQTERSENCPVLEDPSITLLLKRASRGASIRNTVGPHHVCFGHSIYRRIAAADARRAALIMSAEPSRRPLLDGLTSIPSRCRALRGLRELVAAYGEEKGPRGLAERLPELECRHVRIFPSARVVTVLLST